jgi:hypothetical protein
MKDKIMIQVNKFFFASLCTVAFYGCSSNLAQPLNLNKKTNYIAFNKDSKTFFKLDLTNPKYTNQNFQCTFGAYTLSDDNIRYGKLFMESIDLKSKCHWNGLPSGYFEYAVKKQLKIKSIKTVEDIDFSNYSFKTFKVNDSSYLSIIYIFSADDSDRFILDFDGKLYSSLLKKLDKNYVDKYSSKKRFSGDYNYSLSRNNFFEHYYQAEVIKK